MYYITIIYIIYFIDCDHRLYYRIVNKLWSIVKQLLIITIRKHGTFRWIEWRRFVDVVTGARVTRRRRHVNCFCYVHPCVRLIVWNKLWSFTWDVLPGWRGLPEWSANLIMHCVQCVLKCSDRDFLWKILTDVISL